MTLLTGLREDRLNVVGLGGALKIFQMAAHASRIRAREVVVIVDVTLHALHRGMRSRQREAGGRVVKGRARPGGGVVTLLAGLGEARLYVVRLRGALEILEVATHTSRVRGGQGIVPVHVALRALHGGVRSRQGEACAVVIEGRIIPRSRGMTLLAVCRESRLHVVRIGCAVEVLHMARAAIRGRAHELVVDMALCAGDVDVSARQRELRKHVVIERRRIPAARIVASLTGRREAGLGVRRIICLVEIRQMAANAGSRRTYELPTRVAGRAVQRGVRSSEGESSELQVVELCAHPVVHGMALLTTRGQIQLHVVQTRGLGIDKVSLVAREAHR